MGCEGAETNPRRDDSSKTSEPRGPCPINFCRVGDLPVSIHDNSTSHGFCDLLDAWQAHAVTYTGSRRTSSELCLSNFSV